MTVGCGVAMLGELLGYKLVGLRHAIDCLAVGKNLERLPESVQAVKGGEVGFAHLTVMARTLNAVPERFQEGRLLEQARENSPGKFHYVCRHFRHAADPKGYAAEQAEQVENRSLHLSMWEDGSYILNGYLDAVGGAAVRTALEPLARKSGEDDTRELDRRLADALVELAEAACRGRRSRSRARWKRCSAWPARPRRRWTSRSRSQPRRWNDSLVTAA